MRHFNCRCCQARWDTVSDFLDDLELVPVGEVADVDPTFDLSAFQHACGEVVYVSTRHIRAHLFKLRLDAASRTIQERRAPSPIILERMAA